jgi:transcriptional regulator with XRE-family HTH domain
VATPETPVVEEASVVDQVRALTGRLLDLGVATAVAGRALETAGRVSRALRQGQAIEAAGEVVRAVLPGAAEPAWTKTGAAIRALREKAGLTVADVSAAIDLKDPSLIEALENGKMALSFELILRLAAVFGRSDPVGFVMRFTRASNPELWQSLETLGIGKLALQTVREHEFVNIFRGNDEARRLDDDQFAEILGFTRAAFEMAMSLHARHRRREERPDAAVEH